MFFIRIFIAKVLVLFRNYYYLLLLLFKTKRITTASQTSPKTDRNKNCHTLVKEKFKTEGFLLRLPLPSGVRVGDERDGGQDNVREGRGGEGLMFPAATVLGFHRRQAN